MILTDDEIKKAAEFAAEQMWPESGYVGWTEDDDVFHRGFTDALLDKPLKGVEVPEADVRIYRGFATHSTKQLLAYGAAHRLAGQQRETCTWTEQDNKDMPGTYESSCGEMWSFIDGGVKENRVTYCHHCGGKVVPASPQEQT